MRRPLQAGLLGLALAIIWAAQAGAALTPQITSFPASDPASSEAAPYAIAAGSDGALWFSDFTLDKMVRMTTEGSVTLQEPLPPGNAYDIAAGSDGAIWFVSQGPSSVGRVDAAGNVLTKNLSDPLANPTDIVSGPDGALWFAEPGAKKIGRIPAATPLATPDESRSTKEGATGIASGPDGNIWFSMYSASEIGRMEPNGATDYFPLPGPIDNPEAIAAGPDGALWVTTLNPPAIVRFTTGGEPLTHRLPVTPFPGEIAVGADGALWFTASDNIGRITTGGEIETFPLTKGVGVLDIAAGPDGNLWFTQVNAGLIGRITTPPNAATTGATGIGAVMATAEGAVNAHSQPTQVAIEYGPDGAGTTTSAPVQVPASADDQAVSIMLTGLAPSTAYRYRVVATNQTGTTTGAFASLTTAPPPSCRVARTRKARTGTITLALACRAADSVSARATFARKKSARRSVGSARKPSRVLFGRARALVTDGKATLKIKPRKAARARLRSRGRLRVRVEMRVSGGGTQATLGKSVRLRRRPR